MSTPTPTIGESALPPPPSERGASRLSRPATWGLVAASAAGCAYVGLLDPNTTTILPPCPFRSLTGYDCPGCGMTRALHSMLRGDVVGAIDHNLFLVVAIVVGVVWFAVRRIRARMGHEPKPFRITAPAAIALGIVVGAFWLLRNLPVEPFRWFDSGRS